MKNYKSRTWRELGDRGLMLLFGIRLVGFHFSFELCVLSLKMERMNKSTVTIEIKN
jgi:hypothetical protein